MKLGIIIGSTRPGNVSSRVARWVEAEANNLDGAAVSVVDLADYPMPFFDEPISPRYNPSRVVAPEVQKWLDTVAAFDGYVFVTPEYNHGYTAVLKNVLDYMTSEMARKPAAIVSHGSVGGTRAAEQLKLVLLESKAVVVPQATALVNAAGPLDGSGVLNEELKANPYGPQTSLQGTLNELAWYVAALKAANEVHV